MAAAPLLHLATTAGWRAHLAAGAIPAPADVGFVHLSTPDQVVLPADRLFAGRDDLVLLVLDPARIGAEVRWEPGTHGDPAAMRFPHAYGAVPTGAVLAVLPYRPRPDGGFDAPALPALDAGGRTAVFEPSLLRRTATTEVPVAGGVAVLTAPVPASFQHNQLLVDGDVDASTVAAEADRVLGGAGLPHRRALLTGAHLAGTAAGLARRGWRLEHLVGMAAPAGGEPDPRVAQVGSADLRPMWDAGWRRDLPASTPEERAQLADRQDLEAAVVDVRFLAVRDGDEPVAGCALKVDGGTALVDLVDTAPEHHRRGHGDALLATCRALAGRAGCDLVVLEALAGDRSRSWYARRGFTEVTGSWSAVRTG
jgi:uncharacterized protein (DUF952 family)/ribosomal protein S18 acetylase RimI-like enzyme